MRSVMVKGLRDEAGVAMVTVLLVGAVMTVVSSGAAYVTIREVPVWSE